MSPSVSPDPVARRRVLVIGGCGFFGQRLLARLSHQHGLHVVVAGRSAQARALVARLAGTAVAGLEALALDALAASLAGRIAPARRARRRAGQRAVPGVGLPRRMLADLEHETAGLHVSWRAERP